MSEPLTSVTEISFEYGYMDEWPMIIDNSPQCAPRTHYWPYPGSEGQPCLCGKQLYKPVRYCEKCGQELR